MSSFDWSEYRVHEPMSVARVESAGGSHVEPPFDESWSDLDQLRWKAGVVLADTGLRVKIVTGHYSERRLGRDHYPADVYGYNFGWMAGGAYTADVMWTFLTGVVTGVEALRREAA